MSAGALVDRREGAGRRVPPAARRRLEDGALVWSLPNGHVEAGEHDEQAAVREVREETGLDAAIEQPSGRVAARGCGTDDVRWDEAAAMMRHTNERRLGRPAAALLGQPEPM
ncbi:MAG: NUDIX domain-containing protein [bacterium]|nr:NUDIX domain-containing protein [bacterium]